MPLVANIKYHDYHFQQPTAAGSWRWTTRLDVSRATPAYSIRDIVSPYGLLRDSIPLPGDVVQAMSESISELASSFAPHILLGPPTSVNFTVDEGRGFDPGVEVRVTNDGTYGSLLGVQMTSSAAWLRVTPTTIGNLAMNEVGRFQVEVDSTDLVAADSPYSATVTLADPSAVNPSVTLPVSISVRPKAVVDVDTAALLFEVGRPLFPPFPTIAPQEFTVSNVGPVGSSLEFTLAKVTGLSEWLVSFLPASGVLGDGESQVVTVTVVPPANLMPGTYTETIRVSGHSVNEFQDVAVELVVT